jgi:hypothetical protein
MSTTIHDGSRSPTRSARRLLILVFAILALGSLLAVGACRWTNNNETTLGDDPDEETGPPLFRDVTDQSGVKFTYRNGEEAQHLAILESLGGGIAVFDFDGDGLLDVFIPGGGYYDGPKKQDIKGHPCKLYRNKGNFQFEDVTAQCGLDKIDFYTHGAAVADYDRDGWPDLLVTGWHHLALFHNVPRDPKDPTKGRTFVDVSKEAGLPDGLWTTSAAWGDLDGDGYPDLYVCQYVDWSFNNHPLHCTYDGKTDDVCPPKQFTGLEHKLFLNLGKVDGKVKFKDVSKEAGLRVARTDAEFDQLTGLPEKVRERLKYDCKNGDTKFGKGLGVLIVDVNGDGKPDIYVCNDTVDNFLYVNRTKEKGKLLFEEMGMPSGTARDGDANPNGSMGIDAADFNGTGRPSIWVANYENELHALYKNDCTNGRIIFSYYTAPAGLAKFGRMTVGWGTGFFDIDHRGWEDLFLVAGHATRYPKTSPRSQHSILARNKGEGKFRKLTARGGSYFETTHVARGVALADFDNDGRVDLVILHLNEPVAVLRNVADTEGRHWLGVDLAGKDHRDLATAKIVLEAGGRKQTRFVKGGGSYASSPDRRHVFGLGNADRIDKLTVVWEPGKEKTYTDLKLDQYYRLTEGSDKAEPLYQKK